MEIHKIIEEAPQNNLVVESIVKTYAKLKNYDKILCSVSGGSDSDIVLDICQKYDFSDKITYAFFDTGLEYEATKQHLNYLEERYNIHIEKIKAIKSIPSCCKTYGQPFLSKQVSEWIGRLQNHNFQWENEPFPVLYKKYPKCKAALRWWCNDFTKKGKSNSRFNIAYHPYLKEFIIANPPTFRISNKCCYYAKKLVASKFKTQNEFGLNMYGVRKAEGGVRNSAYKTCFTDKNGECDEYRPIFWYINDTKQVYEKHYNIIHSRCYNEYGLKRTGCAGCPYGRDFEEELAVMESHEPKLYRAVKNIFHDSYKYTRAYRDFAKRFDNNMNTKEKK